MKDFGVFVTGLIDIGFIQQLQHITFSFLRVYHAESSRGVHLLQYQKALPLFYLILKELVRYAESSEPLTRMLWIVCPPVRQIVEQAIMIVVATCRAFSPIVPISECPYSPGDGLHGGETKLPQS